MDVNIDLVFTDKYFTSENRNLSFHEYLLVLPEVKKPKGLTKDVGDVGLRRIRMIRVQVY